MRDYLLLGPMCAVAAIAAMAGCSGADSEGAASAESSLGVGGLCGPHEACDQVARGRNAFVDSELSQFGGGNGRACADCHMPSNDFTLSPAAAEARWEALQAAKATDPTADDALFRSVDFDSFAGEPFANLRQNGLVKITLPLPPNIHLFNPATGQVIPSSTVSVWRAVPTVVDTGISGPDGTLPAWARGPNTEGGYQHDARFGSLQEQARAALIDHAQVANPPDIGNPFLADIEAYEQHLSSPPARTDLTPLEQTGKAVFDRSCAACHSGAAFSTPQNLPGWPRYTDILSGCPRPVDGPQFGLPAGALPRWHFKPCPPRLARNMQFFLIQFHAPNGATGTIVLPSSDPGRAILTGTVFGPPPQVGDDWQKFDVAPLTGISKTAPYFTNNSADTLDEVADHYQAFFEFVNVASQGHSPLLFTPDGQSRRLADADKAPLVAYLKTL